MTWQTHACSEGSLPWQGFQGRSTAVHEDCSRPDHGCPCNCHRFPDRPCQGTPIYSIPKQSDYRGSDSRQNSDRTRVISTAQANISGGLASSAFMYGLLKIDFVLHDLRNRTDGCMLTSDCAAATQVRMQSEGKLPEGTPKKYPNAFKAYSIIARSVCSHRLSCTNQMMCRAHMPLSIAQIF